MSCVLIFNISDPTDSTLSSQLLKPVPTTLFNRFLKPTKVLGFTFDEYYPYIDDQVTKDYHKNIFEQGCRIAQSVVVGFNGDFDGRLLPLYTVMCA